MINGSAAPASRWNLRDQSIDLTQGALVGIVNVTPDSFSDGGQFLDPTKAISHGIDLAGSGAKLVDVGGESTRPGSTSIEVDQELARISPVVAGLVEAGATVSIDTTKPEVAAEAVRLGAEVVNDVSAATSGGMSDLIADAGCSVVLAHMQGTPEDMQDDPRYDDVVGEVETYLLERAASLEAEGVRPGRIAIDPGIGFGKTIEHNLRLLQAVPRLSSHGYPLMLGTSRKRFLSVITKSESLEARDVATGLTTAHGFASGARLFRVHNVEISRRALALAGAIVAPLQWDEWLLD